MHEHARSNVLPTAALMLWTLLPCAAMWVGLYQLKSAFWAFALYDVICLLPAIIWGRHLWLPTLRKPSRKDLALLLATALIFSAGAVIGYELIGTFLLSNEHVPLLLRLLGINGLLCIVFGLYGTVVNPVVEELFWRGVVLNQIDQTASKLKYFGIAWSSFFYALFHYLIFRLVLFPVFAEIGTLLLALYGMALIYRKTGSIVTTAIAHGLLTDLACVMLLADYYRKFGSF